VRMGERKVCLKGNQIHVNPQNKVGGKKGGKSGVLNSF